MKDIFNLWALRYTQLQQVVAGKNGVHVQRHIDKFINYLKVEKNSSSNTITNYLVDLKAFERFLGDKDILAVDHLALRKFLAEMRAKNFSKRTIARKLASLRTFFKFMYREGHIKTNPITAIATPKLDKRLPVVLDEGKVNKLLDCPPGDTIAGLRDKAILELLFSTGLRVSELCSLSREISTEFDELSIRGKGGKVRVGGGAEDLISGDDG